MRIFEPENDAAFAGAPYAMARALESARIVEALFEEAGTIGLANSDDFIDLIVLARHAAKSTDEWQALVGRVKGRARFLQSPPRIVRVSPRAATGPEMPKARMTAHSGYKWEPSSRATAASV